MSRSSLNSSLFTPITDRATKKRKERKARPDPSIDEVIPDCGWSSGRYRVEAPDASENITLLRPGYTFIYTYPFSMALDNPIDSVINLLYDTFLIVLGPAWPRTTESHRLPLYVGCRDRRRVYFDALATVVLPLLCSRRDNTASPSWKEVTTR
ncbi:hypothetical protein HAX54_008000 [Datura stramonium]|uniref:Uncharacterized protein n=1 Tax=Datura stramonium TaxID=4076 RepID=A0ABS8WUZ3_DATST|nr:hypothetical protein [Datura stramonium]